VFKSQSKIALNYQIAG